MDKINKKYCAVSRKNTKISFSSQKRVNILDLIEDSAFIFDEACKDNCKGMEPDALSDLMEKAIQYNHVDIVVWLIENKDVDINATYGDIEMTALMLAASQGRDSIIEALLSREDIDPNAQNQMGNTALMEATIFCRGNKLSAEQSTFINLFLENENCHISTQNTAGFTAFDLAMTHFYAPQSYQKHFLENLIFENYKTLKLASGFFDFNAVLSTSSNNEELDGFMLEQQNNVFYQDITTGVSLNALSNAFIEKQAPGIIEAQMPEFSSHFNALFARWDQDELADSQQLAHSIKQGLPVSFTIKATLGNNAHCMAISIDKGLAIITNRGGMLDLLTGELIDRDNLQPGKRLIDVSSNLQQWDARFIEGLMHGDQATIKALFQNPLIGFISMSEQSRQNCALVHPTAMMMDQCLFADFRNQHPENNNLAEYIKNQSDPEVIFCNSDSYLNALGISSNIKDFVLETYRIYKELNPVIDFFNASYSLSPQQKVNLMTFQNELVSSINTKLNKTYTWEELETRYNNFNDLVQNKRINPRDLDSFEKFNQITGTAIELNKTNIIEKAYSNYKTITFGLRASLLQEYAKSMSDNEDTPDSLLMDYLTNFGENIPIQTAMDSDTMLSHSMEDETNHNCTSNDWDDSIYETAGEEALIRSDFEQKGINWLQSNTIEVMLQSLQRKIKKVTSSQNLKDKLGREITEA